MKNKIKTGPTFNGVTQQYIETDKGNLTVNTHDFMYKGYFVQAQANALIYKNGEFVKAFAGDCVEGGKTAEQKAIAWIDRQ